MKLVTHREVELVYLMSRAHKMHHPDPRRVLVHGCSGISDPLTGHHCQFTGTGQEWVNHLMERFRAALESDDE